MQCIEDEATQPYAPLVAGRVAEAELFTYGGPEGLLDWGPTGGWHAGSRDFGPEPSSKDPSDIWRSITIGDLNGDGPDILTSAGTSGAVPEEPASGRVSVLYGNTAEGVPSQHATTFPSELGVEGIATGDFDLDGHTDVVGTDFHYSAATGGIAGVFFQSGDGAGHLGAPQELPLYSGERFNYAPVRVADLDGNGTPDVVAIVGGEVRVLLNEKARPVLNPIAPGVSRLNATPPAKPLSGIKKLPKLVTALANGVLLLGTATNPPTARVGLTIIIPAKGKAKGAALVADRPKKVKPMVIGKVQIKIAAGKTVTLKVKLSTAALKLLKKGALHARLTIAAVSATGAKQTETVMLTIKPPKSRHGRKK